MANRCKKCGQSIQGKIKKGDRFVSGTDIHGREIIQEVLAVFENIVFVNYCGVQLYKKSVVETWKKVSLPY